MLMMLLRLIAGYSAAVESDKVAACTVHYVPGTKGGK
jgi:hypothetical protein